MSTLHSRWASLGLAGAFLLTACARSPSEGPVGEIDQAVLPMCPYSTGGIDFDHELIIRDVNVVEDACRTNNGPPMGVGWCSTINLGRWTFEHLMTMISGPGAVVSVVNGWLSYMESTRANFRTQFLDPWFKASGCAPGSP